jgi:N-methylhydantoinase B
MNSSHANMQSACVMAIAYLLDPDIPKNAGAFRPVTVKAREGTIVWAEPGRPVTMCTSHPSDEIVEAIVKALSASCPDRPWRAGAAASGSQFRARTRARPWLHLAHVPRPPGGGASPGGDGWSTAGEWHTVGGLKFGSVEFAEVRFPLHFRQHEFLPDSGGEGQFRGGLGAALDLVVETAKPALANTAGDGVRYGACGMLGGQDAPPHRYRLISDGREPRVLKTKETNIPSGPGTCSRCAPAAAAAGARRRSAAPPRASGTLRKVF